MRIRTQLIAAAATAAAVSMVIIIGLVVVTQKASAGLAEHAEAEEAARNVASMLSLTNELAAYGSERAIPQWRARHAELLKAVQSAAARRPAPQELLDLERAIAGLPGTFDALVQVSQEPQTPLSSRQRELLQGRLLSETQAIVEGRYRWAMLIGQARLRDQRLYTTMVLTAPAALLLVLFVLGGLICMRVLGPLARLEKAVKAMQGGDLTVRCASLSADELGEASRAVDAMAMALQHERAAVEASEHHLRLIADNLPALVAHLDADLRFTFVNAPVGRVARAPPQSLLGRPLREVLGSAAFDIWSAHIKQVMRGTAVTFETHGVTRGKPRHYQLNFVPDVDEQGHARGFYAMSFDITAPKEAERQRAASERFLADIADNMPALVAYIDSEQRYCFANAKYRLWLNLDPQRMIGRTLEATLGPEVQSDLTPGMLRALGGERAQHTWRCERDGVARYLQSEWIPDRAVDGTVRGCYALTIDITERHEAQARLARGERRLQDITNNLPATVAYFDMQERCQYANDTALKSHGLERTDVTGMMLREVLGESNYAQHEPYVQEALKGRRARLDGKIDFPGRAAHFQAHLVPDRVEGGAQRGVYLMTFDITALKEAQQQHARIERQLRAITDNLPVLIAYVDADERYTFINNTCKDWFGVEPSQLIGRKVSEALSPALYEQRRGSLRLALSGQRVAFDVASELQRGLRHLHNIYMPDIQSDGTVAGIFALSSDVTG